MRWLALVLPWIAALDAVTVRGLPERAGTILRRTGVPSALRVPAFTSIVLLTMVLEATVCFFVVRGTGVFTGVGVTTAVGMVSCACPMAYKPWLLCMLQALRRPATCWLGCPCLYGASPAYQCSRVKASAQLEQCLMQSDGRQRFVQQHGVGAARLTDALWRSVAGDDDGGQDSL